MHHQLYENESSSIPDQIAAWAEVRDRAEAALSTLRTIVDRFPDAEDRGQYKGRARWASRAAHEMATHFDPSSSDGHAGFAYGALYLELEGGGRIYSARPVCLREGFELFQSKGFAGTLIDALRSTTEMAEGRVSDYEAKRKLEESERAARDAAEKAATAQPVRVLGEVTVVSSSLTAPS